LRSIDEEKMFLQEHIEFVAVAVDIDIITAVARAVL
jgi:hypothetical protein